MIFVEIDKLIKVDINMYTTRNTNQSLTWVCGYNHLLEMLPGLIGNGKKKVWALYNGYWENSFLIDRICARFPFNIFPILLLSDLSTFGREV